jgi:hypothetical protein
MKKIKWSGDKLLGISALVISLATLISLVYQARITREHEVKSSFPKLELWTSRNGKNFKLILVNTGLGPAILEDISVLYDDRLYQLDHVNFYRKFMDTVENSAVHDRFSYSNISPGRVIPAGEEMNLLDATRGIKTITDPFDSLFSSKARLIIKYSSVYEQMWEVEMNGLSKIIDEEPKVIQSMLD